MQYTVPHYYKKFQCIGGKCEDTCCVGWQIMIDQNTLKKYSKVKGGFGNRLHNEINWKQGCFRQYEKRCAFLNEENLCDIYLEGGKDLFCKTCRLYPRHIEEFEGLKEISLSLSCPTVAELILGCEEAVTFLHAQNEKEEPEIPDFDYLLFTKLMDTRKLMFEILQNREKPFALRASIILALAHDLQERISRNALFQVDELLERYSQNRVWEWFEKRISSYREKEKLREVTMGNLLVILKQLETLQADWGTYISKAKKIITYPINEREGLSEVMLEQLSMYFIYTYFCGAVYDGKAYGKIKFAFASVYIIQEIARAVGVSNIYEVARYYSREIEHSDFNKNKLEVLLEDEEKFGLNSFLVLFST